jgi:hypothetical protein
MYGRETAQVHVACMGERRHRCMQSFGGERGMKSLLEVGINGRIILK